MKKVLLIAHAEICHQPRLIKAADFLKEKGYSITVFNPITGLAAPEIYEDFKSSRDWHFIENRIDKKDWRSYLNWFLSGVIWKISKILFTYKINLWSEYFANKGLATANLSGNFDIIIINLVDNLPFASLIKNKTNCKVLIYDSQEFFLGQFPKNEYPDFNDWIYINEPKYLPFVDIILTTTDAMKDRLVSIYGLAKQSSLRVRNAPWIKDSRNIVEAKVNSNAKEIKCIWHGFKVHLNNERGVHTIVQSISKCSFPVSLTLQGVYDLKTQEEIDAINRNLPQYVRLYLKPPAPPDQIVESLDGYDIAIQGEHGVNDNQLLTSSNKIFESIAAGLMVITPDLPGLKETIDAYPVGLLYESGNSDSLLMQLEFINSNRDLLSEFKKNSKNAFLSGLNWQTDYTPVYEKIVELCEKS